MLGVLVLNGVDGEVDGELCTIHGLGDSGSTTGDHQIGVVGVTSHDVGVVDQQPGVVGL
jgi:hypothetical protein